jgi:hypothetical protein
MKRITALIIIIISSIILFQSPISAADWYTVKLTREVHLDNSTQFNVIKSFNLHNTSFQYLIKSFDYFSPLPFSDAQASINDKNLNISINGSHITIDLGNEFLKPSMSVDLVIKLKVPDLVNPVRTSSGKVLGAELFFPKDTTKALDIFSQTTIFFDKTKFAPSYISTENKLDDGKISFTKNVDIFIDFSQVGGFNIKYSGENNRVLLPSSVFNKVIYDNIPQDGVLSNDSLGNTFLEKDGVIEYELRGLKNSNLDLKNIKQPQYFPKDALGGFTLDAEVKNLYRQVIDKYSPETQKINTSTLSISDYLKNDFNDSLAYSLTLASLIQQKEIPAQVVFGKAKFPLSEDLIWHFWVITEQNNKVVQLDPFMEDLLGFDGFTNVPPQRAIICSYQNDSALIDSIDNLINDSTEVEYLETSVSDVEVPLAQLEVKKIPDSFYPKIGLVYKNLSSSTIKIEGLSINGQFNSTPNIEIAPGSQEEFEISLALNIIDIVSKKGDIKITAQVNDNGTQILYDTNTQIPPQALLWIVTINFLSVFVGLALIIIFSKYKRTKID